MTEGETPAVPVNGLLRSRSNRARRAGRVRGRRNGGSLIFARDLLVIVLVAILASLVIKTFLVRSFYIPSASMQNTLQINDRILVNELVPKVVPLQHGDVVVFQDPGGWLDNGPAPALSPIAGAGEWLLGLVGLSTQDKNDHLIKRVIGLPGDHVVCCNALGQMSINGTPLDEPYVVKPSKASAVSRTSFNVVVPAGKLWVMGDNRYNSEDSRYQRSTPGNGFVPISDVVGRALVISWPLDRWNYLSNYPDTFGGVPAAK